MVYVNIFPELKFENGNDPSLLPANIEKWNNFNQKCSEQSVSDCCADRTLQASCDGVWLCNAETGINERDNTKIIKINKKTQQEISDEEFAAADDKDVCEVPDWIPYPSESLNYTFDPDSGVTMADVEAQGLLNHQDYGNGMTNPFVINGKPCLMLITKVKIPNLKFQEISQRIKDLNSNIV